MKRVFWGLCGSLLYMELVYHTASFGWKEMNPILLLPLILLVAGIETIVCGIIKEKVRAKVFLGILIANYLLFAAQLVYVSIFQQPLLFAAMAGAGQDALTDFWKEGLIGIFKCTGSLLVLAIPYAICIFAQKKGLLSLPSRKKEEFLPLAVSTSVGFFCTVLIIASGYINDWNLYEEYKGFYDPSKVISMYGVLPTIQRDWFGWMMPEKGSALEAIVEADVEEETVEEVKEFGDNVLDVDFDKLNDLADNDTLKQLTAYMKAATPTKENEYTGMFKGYNLIYLTAEGFSQYAVDEELTPTLYKLTHSGFVCEDYYVPLWQTSTSDGEYVNMTGLVPDQQLSFKRTAENDHPFALPAYFEAEGVKSYAYHNNSLTYYDRHKTHPNLGYDFKAAKLGKLTQEEGGDQLFEIESAESWPASDLEMIQATLPEYINDDRFHAYYMTVSGHMQYTFSANSMSYRNREAVESLPYSDEVKAYIACNMELDKALEYLIEELDKAGKLENTVIALSADHYPYGLENDKIEELTDKDLDDSLELYRNSLILWNSEMETVTIEKTCSAIDLLPTLYNLFGFDYDSRLFAGKDMLSDSESFVVFADRSFITDKVIYNRDTGEVISRTDEPVDDEYISKMKDIVQALFEYSAGILNENFHYYVDQASVKEDADIEIGSTEEEKPTPTQAPEDKEDKKEQADKEEKSDKEEKEDKSDKADKEDQSDKSNKKENESDKTDKNQTSKDKTNEEDGVIMPEVYD